MTTDEILEQLLYEIKNQGTQLHSLDVSLENIFRALRPSEELLTGQCLVTAAGTPQQLLTGITPCRRVIVQAFFQNTDNVSVGRQGTSVAAGAGSSLTDKGRTLKAGEAEIFHIFDASLLWINSVVSGEGVTYVIEKDNN